jgi:hypothetical protein
MLRGHVTTKHYVPVRPQLASVDVDCSEEALLRDVRPAKVECEISLLLKRSIFSSHMISQRTAGMSGLLLTNHASR